MTNWFEIRTGIGSAPTPSLLAGLAVLLVGATPALAQSAPGAGEPIGPRILEVAERIWRFELLRVGGEPIQVNQVFVAILVFALGLIVSRILTRRLRMRLLSRQRVTANAAAAIEKLTFYGLLVIVTLTALQTVNIPITVFTLLGGAVAIGVGFGAQSIFNNFISGLLLMFSGQIRIGDLVEVEGSLGHVEEIGGRVTRVKRMDGVDVLVPNSLLLENRVINWTLSDDRLRTSVVVGVIYGSPLEKVKAMILQAVSEHTRVLADPSPTLVFDDFGDNALVFEVFFWTEVKSMMELRVIRSDIRFRIDHLFREAGVVIAFPQRDVHLDTARPLEVRVLPGTTR